MASCSGCSGFQDRSGGGEDAGGIAVGNFLFVFQPVLDVASAEFRAFETECFARDQGDGFGLDLAQMGSSEFSLQESFGCCVPENNVGDFVERGLVRESGQKGATPTNAIASPLNQLNAAGQN